MLRASGFSDRRCGAPRPEVAAADNDVYGQACQPFSQALRVLGTEHSKGVRVVLVAGLESVGGVRLTLTVTNDDELLIVVHAAAPNDLSAS
jgi:hypothetical protein